jgi:HEAT repeat protein
MSSEPEVIPFQQLLDTLTDEQTQFQNRELYRLSDLDEKELDSLKHVWLQIPLSRRISILHDLLRLGENNFLLSYEAIGRFAITDDDPTIRKLAVQILKGFESIDLVPKFMNLLELDADEDVQATCASALSRFVYLGELDKISKATLRQIEDCLLHSLQSSHSETVKRRSLEAIGYSSRPEVPPLIEDALKSGDKKWIKSALSAIGRSIDERWESDVLDFLDNKLPSLRAEAAKAAGELEISAALPRLIELTDDSDEDVRRASIWSLSQISGEGVREILQELWKYAEDEMEMEIELIEAALDNLEFNENPELFTLIEFPENEDEYLDEHYLTSFDDDYLSQDDQVDIPD